MLQSHHPDRQVHDPIPRELVEQVGDVEEARPGHHHVHETVHETMDDPVDTRSGNREEEEEGRDDLPQRESETH